MSARVLHFCRFLRHSPHDVDVTPLSIALEKIGLTLCVRAYGGFALSSYGQRTRTKPVLQPCGLLLSLSHRTGRLLVLCELAGHQRSLSASLTAPIAQPRVKRKSPDSPIQLPKRP